MPPAGRARHNIALVPWRSAHQLLLENEDDEPPSEEEVERGAAAEHAELRAAVAVRESDARHASQVVLRRRNRSQVVGSP